VKVRGVIRADARPRYRATGKCRPETKNLRHCSRWCWGVDEIFSTDTRGHNEDKNKRNPSTILVPEEGQGNPAVAPDGGDKAHQLRTLIPQKDTYPSMRLES
jgi:hypothetical protein